MFEGIKKFAKDYTDAVKSHHAASRAAQAELISEARAQTSEARAQTALLHKRDNELDTITSHLSYLARIEADKRSRAGHPSI
jgi:hypothetical protein